MSVGAQITGSAFVASVALDGLARDWHPATVVYLVLLAVAVVSLLLLVVDSRRSP